MASGPAAAVRRQRCGSSLPGRDAPGFEATVRRLVFPLSRQLDSVGYEFRRGLPPLTEGCTTLFVKCKCICSTINTLCPTTCLVTSLY